MAFRLFTFERTEPAQFTVLKTNRGMNPRAEREFFQSRTPPGLFILSLLTISVRLRVGLYLRL
jgi:hypothetical protein